MKKIVLMLLAALSLVSCNPDDNNPAFVLKKDNVQVLNTDYDYIVTVSGNKVEIVLDYLDRGNARALEIGFTDLPEDIDPVFSSIYDYSGGNTQTIAFGKKEYVFSVTFAAPQPKFLTAKLDYAEVSLSSHEAKLTRKDSLENVVFVFTVSPEDTRVSVAGKEICSGDTLDFSDKANGVTFTLSCEGAVAYETIKVVTAGINTVTRVWGHYVKPQTLTDTWFGDKVNNTLDLIRTVALNDEWVFLSRDVRKDSQSVAEKAGVYAVHIADSDSVYNMSTNGLSDGDRIFAISVLGNDCIAATFANGSGAHLKIFRYNGVTADPSQVLDYTLPSNARLGDRITVEGDWNSGKIMAYDNTSANKVYCFAVTSGSVSQTPAIIDLDVPGGSYAGFYKYQDGVYVLGTNGVATGCYSVSGTTATKLFSFDTANYASPMHGIQFFTVNDIEYMGYVVLQNSFQDGQFRITPLVGETFQASVEEAVNPYAFWLGDPGVEEAITANKNGNGLGMGMFRRVDNHNYYAAYVPGAGLSLFDIQ